MSDNASSSSLSIDKESILDSFPFQEDELDQLLRLYDEDVSVVAERISSETAAIPSLDLPDDCTSSLLHQSILSAFCLIDTPLNKYMEGLSVLLGRRGPRPLLDVLWTCTQNVQAESESKATLLEWIYRISVASRVLQTTDCRHDNLFVEDSLVLGTAVPAEWHLVDLSSRPLFMEWANMKLPQIYTAVATFFHGILLREFSPGKTPVLQFPILDKQSDIPLDLLSLALLSSKLQGNWRRLYNNLDDGSSFEILQQALIGYQGPTTIVIQTTRGEVFGYFTECPWKLSSKWFGAPGTNVSHFYDNADSFLFTLKPQLQLYPATGSGKYYQYLHMPAAHRTNEIKGLCIGGITHDCPRVHLTTDWTRCKATSVDTTYENGPLLEQDENFFTASVIEAYATSVGDDTFQINQTKGRLKMDISESGRRQAASVDKAQFLNDLESEIYMNKGFAHRDVVQGGDGA